MFGHPFKVSNFGVYQEQRRNLALKEHKQWQHPTQMWPATNNKSNQINKKRTIRIKFVRGKKI
jgi:hypothetical protein